MTDTQNAQNFLKAIDDDFIQVRTEDNPPRLLGCIPGKLPPGTSEITPANGGRYQVGILMVPAIVISTSRGQDPRHIPGFIPYETVNVDAAIKPRDDKPRPLTDADFEPLR
jgi:hypothetical protein